MKTLTVMLGVLFLAGCSTVPPASLQQSTDLQVHFFNVGAGMCQLMTCPGAKASPILADCGSSGRSDSDLTKDQVAQLISSLTQNLALPPIVVISHKDSDHHNWIPGVLGQKKAKAIFISGTINDYADATKKWLVEQNNHGVTIYDQLSGGVKTVDALACGTAKSKILAANVGNTSNSKSLVFMTEYRGKKILFTGDAQESTQMAVMKLFKTRQNEVIGPILSVPHHGAVSHGSNNAAWAEFIQPKVAVYNAGTKHLHPRCGAVDAYRRYLVTSQDHNVGCGSDGDWSWLETDKAEYVTEDQGTISVTIDRDGVVSVGCSSQTSNCAISSW